ncbi:unnamed protein product [Pylaiella littoralis]
MRKKHLALRLLAPRIILSIVWLGVSTAVGGQDDQGEDGSATKPRFTTDINSSSHAVSDEAVVVVGVGQPETNRCTDVDMSVFSNGITCGSPLSEPCFDFGRCESGSGIYVHAANCSLWDTSALLAFDKTVEADGGTLKRRPKFEYDDYIASLLRDEAKKAGSLAQTYESACMFVHAISSANQGYTLCAVEKPLWNDGANHVLIDLSDKGRNKRLPVAKSYAMEAASNMHSCFYRSGYDISVPLAPKEKFDSLSGILPWDRKFVVTTKGSVYLSMHGSEERMSLVPIHDEENGVITSMRCFEMHNEHLLPENVEYCQTLKDRFDDYDYASLMNTTFGLVPAGRSPGTYRLGEVMSAGAIPVFVGRDIVPPFLEQFDWSSFSFMFAPDQVGPSLVKTLRAIPRAELEEMQRKSLEVYREMFGMDVYSFRPSAKIIVDIIRRRLRHQWRE